MEILHFLNKFQGVKQTEPNEWQAKCPSHDDRVASLSIGLRGEKILVNCHAGCRTEDVLQAVNLQMRDLFLDCPQRAETRQARHKSITETVMLQGSEGYWNYTDEEGVVLYRMVRYPQGNGKRFVAYRPNGNGRWISGITGVRRVSYGLPELMEADPSEPVFVVEGEKHVNRLRSLGLTATCNPFGAGKWCSEYCEPLRDRNVVILPDNDEPGRRHGNQVAKSLQGIAHSIDTVVLPALLPKGDIIDWLDAGHDTAELLGLVRSTQKVASAVAAPEPKQHSVAHLTDMGNAERLVQLHGRDLHYCYPSARWLVWDGTRWNTNQEGALVYRAKNTVRGIYAEASKATDSTERRQIAEWAKRSEGETRLNAMISLARSEPGIPILPEALDSKPWLLNVTNGTINLNTGDLQPHRREDLCTKLAPVNYDPNATCPLWVQFLNRILDGKQDLIAFVQRAVGYALTGSTREQVLFMLYGTGANGKSTFLEILQAMLGDYAKYAEFETFLARKSSGPRNDIADLVGARLVCAQEIEGGARLAESVVKHLTGGDTVKARFLFREFFEFKPQFKLFLAANHKPVIRGTDLAIWRRIHLLPFTVVIPPEEQDKDLPSKLKDELAGIMTWAVRGCLAWQSDGLTPPKSVIAATQEYREEMDILAGFLVECCVINTNAKARAGELYAAYREWCEKNGEKPVSQRNFGSRLQERGLKSARTRRYRMWEGIGIQVEGDAVTQGDAISGKSLHEKNQAEVSGKSCHMRHHSQRSSSQIPLTTSIDACDATVTGGTKNDDAVTQRSVIPEAEESDENDAESLVI